MKRSINIITISVIAFVWQMGYPQVLYAGIETVACCDSRGYCGYGIGSSWHDTDNGTQYICTCDSGGGSCSASDSSGSDPSGQSSSYGYSGGLSMQNTIQLQIFQGLINGFIQGYNNSIANAQRQALQKKWEKEEKERHMSEKKRQEAAFADAQAGALDLLGNRPVDEFGIADGLKPGGNSFFGLGGGPGSETNMDAMNDPMVVDLRDLRRASYFAQAVETASTEDVPLLLDEALKIANGTMSSLGGIPPGALLPEIDDRGLLAFQQANIDYAKSQDFLFKCTEDLKTIQQRRELAHRTAEARRAEVEKMMAGKTDEASLKKKQELLAEISASLRAEDEAWLKAKAQLREAEDLAYKTREESVRILRALATSQDQADFHPPIASLPALKQEDWIEMQKRMFEERQKLDEEQNKLQKELASFVPPLKGPERVQEGVILGTNTDKNDASNMEGDGVSPYTGQTLADMKQAAEQAREEGKEIGGSMVVSFGTSKQKINPYDPFVEEKRVIADHLTTGEFSLSTPQAEEALNKLAGKEFDRLIAHSNGASIAEALIRKDIITVNELNIVGGDRSLANGLALQKLLDSGKVKRVVVWVDLNDPVPGLTSMDPLNLSGQGRDAVIHLVKKITGDLAGGDTTVEYRRCGTDSHGVSIKAHYLESSYYPCMANELGVKYTTPERALDEK